MIFIIVLTETSQHTATKFILHFLPSTLVYLLCFVGHVFLVIPRYKHKLWRFGGELHEKCLKSSETEGNEKTLISSITWMDCRWYLQLSFPMKLLINTIQNWNCGDSFRVTEQVPDSQRCKPTQMQQKLHKIVFLLWILIDYYHPYFLCPLFLPLIYLTSSWTLPNFTRWNLCSKFLEEGFITAKVLLQNINREGAIVKIESMFIILHYLYTFYRQFLGEG